MTDIDLPNSSTNHCADRTSELVQGIETTAPTPPITDRRLLHQELSKAHVTSITDSHSKTQLSESALTKELSLIEAVSAQTSKWNFLPSQSQERLIKNCKSLSLEGYKSPEIELMPLPTGALSTIIRFSPSGDKIEKSIKEQFSAIEDKIRPILVELAKEGTISESDYRIEQHGDKLSFKINLYAGANFQIPKEPELKSSNFEDKKIRTQAWEILIGDVAYANLLGSSFAQVEANRHARASSLVSGLSDYYFKNGPEEIAHLVSGLAAIITPRIETLQRYCDEGHIDPKTLTLQSSEIHKAIKIVNEVSKNIPNREYYQKLKETTLESPRSDLLETLCELERESETYPAIIVERAELEIREAMRYVNQKRSEVCELTNEKAAQIVTSYFSEHAPSEYIFEDQTPGISAGLYLRRTDCSTRALLAYDMLRLMGLDAGVESILEVKDGKEIPGVMGHMYNYVLNQDGSKTYFDFGLSAKEKNGFDSRNEIVQHYRSPNPDHSIKILSETRDPVEIFKEIYGEPIRTQAGMFIERFQSQNLDLNDFLVNNPDMAPAVESIKRYAKAKDKILNTNELKIWESGDRQWILSIFKN